MIARVSAALALVCWIGSTAKVEAAGALLQGLDKVTARVASFTAEIGKPVRFGQLEITAKACVKSPPLEPPRTAVFLSIDEYHGDAKSDVFSGWMFAEAPALHTLEDPVYDIRLLDCAPDPAPQPAGPVTKPATPQPPAKPAKPAG